MRFFFLITAGLVFLLFFILLPAPPCLKWTAFGILTGNILLMGLPGGFIFFFFRPILTLFASKDKVFTPGDNLWPLAILSGVLFPLGMVPMHYLALIFNQKILQFSFPLTLSGFFIVWAMISVCLSFWMIETGNPSALKK